MELLITVLQIVGGLLCVVGTFFLVRVSYRARKSDKIGWRAVDWRAYLKGVLLLFLGVGLAVHLPEFLKGF